MANYYTLEIEGSDEPYEVYASSEEEAVAQLRGYLEQQGVAAPPAPVTPMGAAPPAPMGAEMGPADESGYAPPMMRYSPDTAMDMGITQPDAEPQSSGIFPAISGPYGPSMDLLRGAATGTLARTVVGPGAMISYAYANMGNRLLNLMGAGEDPETLVDDYDDAGRDFLNMVRGTELENASRETKAAESVFDFATMLAFSPKNSLTSLPKALGTAAAEGGLAAATTFDSLSDMAGKTHSIAAGALMGAGATLGIKGLGWGLGKVGQWALNKINANGAEDQAAIIAWLDDGTPDAIFPGLAGLLTMGQKSGSNAMLKLEADVAGEEALKAYRAQAAILEEGLKRFAARYGGNWNPEEIAAIAAKRGQSFMTTMLSDMAKVRKLEWNTMIDAAEASVKAGPGAKAGKIVTGEESLFRVEGLEAKMTDLLDKWDIDKTGLDGIFRQFADEVTTFKDGVSMDTFLKMLKKTNGNIWNVSKQLPNEEARAAFGKEFREMIFEGIDAADESQGRAVAFIKAARGSYTTRSNDMDVARKSSIAKHLGLDSAAAEPHEALRAIANMSPEEGARAATWLGKPKELGGDPQLLSEIRRIAWDDAIKEATARIPSNASAHPFDPFRMTQLMLGRIGTEGASATPAIRQFRSLFSEADRINMLDLLPKISRIMAHPPKGARAFDPESGAMTFLGAAVNAPTKGIAQYLPFMVRNMYRLGASDWLDARLFTSAGRRLIDDADKAVGTGRYNQAVGALAVYMFGTEPSMRLK